MRSQSELFCASQNCADVASEPELFPLPPAPGELPIPPALPKPPVLPNPPVLAPLAQTRSQAPAGATVHTAHVSSSRLSVHALAKSEFTFLPGPQLGPNAALPL